MKNFMILGSAILGVLMMMSCDGIDCNCGEQIPFFDFGKIEFRSTEPTDSIVGLSDVYDFELILEDVEYLANDDHNFHYDFSLFPSAYACTCIENGWEGLKFPLDGFKLTSNNNWADTLLAGADLGHLLLTDIFENEDYKPVSDLLEEERLLSPYDFNRFRITDRPRQDMEHILTLEFQKSNGVNVSIELPAAEWE